MADDPKDKSSLHNVNFMVTSVSYGTVVRGPHQNIKAIINGRLGIDHARELVKILQAQIDGYEEGKGPITITMEGEFT